jgi:ribosomal protein S27AE
MFDIFGIRARRKAKQEEAEKVRLEELAQKKKAYQERKAKICAFLEENNRKENERTSKEYVKELERVKEYNSKCPKCGSKNIVNHIRRTKGEIHGEGKSYTTGSSSHFLFSSHSSFSSGSHSKIDGELDTLPVNRCNDCGNEWVIKEAQYPKTCNKFSHYSSLTPGFLYRRVTEYLDLKYNPEDITEECNSLEEKREAFFNTYKASFWFDGYRELPKYMLDYVLWEGINERHYRLEAVQKDPFWGVTENTDQYSYEMPEKLWNIVQRIIGWNPSRAID